MAQFQRLRSRISCVNVEIRLFCLLILFGSLFGALCQKLHGSTLALEPNDTASVLRCWLRTAAFPVLLSLPLIIKTKHVFYFLFFMKGALIAYTICVIMKTTGSLRNHLLCSLFFESVLPLPGYLLISSVWSDQIYDPRPAFWLLIPACCLPLIGIFLKILLL